MSIKLFEAISDRDIYKKIIGPSFGVLLFTFVSQVFGYLRESLFAYYLGNSVQLQSFQIAETIPLIFTQIIVSVAPLALTPLFVRDKTNNLFRNAIVLCLTVTSIILIAVEVFAEYMVIAFAPTLEGEAFAITVRLSRILMPNVLFLSTAAIFNAFLCSREQFVLPTLVYSFLNVFMVITQVISAGNVIMVAFVSMSTSLCICIFLACLCRAYCKEESKEWLSRSGIVEVIKTMGPVLVAALFTSVILLLDKHYASISNGVVVYTYAYKLMYLPVHLFATSFTRVLLPQITRLAVTDNNRATFRVIKNYVLCSVGATIIASLFVWRLGKYLVAIVYGHGRYTSEDVMMTTSCLGIMILGVAGIAISNFCQSVAYAYKKYMLPLKVIWIQLLVYIVINVVFKEIMGVNAVALANVVSYSIMGIVWVIVLRRRLL